jgi:hypothetical protein
MAEAARQPGHYYQVLGIELAPSEVTADHIKTAYKKACLRYHPDRNAGDPSATQKFQEIQKAYEVLSNPRHRSVYDSWGGEGLQQYEDEKLDAFEAALGLTSPLFKSMLRWPILFGIWLLVLASCSYLGLSLDRAAVLGLSIWRGPVLFLHQLITVAIVRNPRPNVRYVLPIVATAALVLLLDLVIYAFTPKLLLSWSADVALLSALLLLVNFEIRQWDLSLGLFVVMLPPLLYVRNVGSFVAQLLTAHVALMCWVVVVGQVVLMQLPRPVQTYPSRYALPIAKIAGGLLLLPIALFLRLKVTSAGYFVYGALLGFFALDSLVTRWLPRIEYLLPILAELLVPLYVVIFNPRARSGRFIGRKLLHAVIAAAMLLLPGWLRTLAASLALYVGLAQMLHLAKEPLLPLVVIFVCDLVFRGIPAATWPFVTCFSTVCAVSWVLDNPGPGDEQPAADAESEQEPPSHGWEEATSPPPQPPRRKKGRR